jgi:hydroxyacylglutathione hydrolase
VRPWHLKFSSASKKYRDHSDIMLKAYTIPVTPFEQNCTLLVCESTKLAAVSDPGGDLHKIEKAIQTLGVKLEKVLLTHGHIDHCGEASIFAKRHQVPIEGPHEEDAFWIDQLPEQGKRFGFNRLDAFTPERWLNDGDRVYVGEQELEVYHCPGHTPGHVVFFHRSSQLAIVGDVLFDGSIGRTDFPRGNHQDLIDSITTKLWPLGAEVTFVPGHGPTSTFGEQRRRNPFVSDASLA